MGLGLVLVVGSFLLGRNSTATDRSEPEPEPLRAALVADVLGPGEVQTTVDFADATTAVLVCRSIDTPEGTRADMRVVHIGANGDGEQILSYQHLADVPSCEACSYVPEQLAGEALLIGECAFASSGPSPGIRARIETTSAFVVSEPAAPGVSAIGMNLMCGITRLSVEDDELVLSATQPRYAGNPNPPTPLPPMRFSRQDGEFVADDVGVLDHFCAITPDTQLVDLPPFVFALTRQRELSHLVINSDIGKIGFRNAVLVGLTPNQCNTLQRAQFGLNGSGVEAPTLASITGLDPPEGYDDWFFTCQIDADR